MFHTNIGFLAIEKNKKEHRLLGVLRNSCQVTLPFVPSWSKHLATRQQGLGPSQKNSY
jgi:hypothetical protein